VKISLAILAVAAILCALALTGQPACYSRGHSWLAANVATVWTVSDSGLEQSGWRVMTARDKASTFRAVLLFGVDAPERPLIMAKQKVVSPLPLHVVQSIHQTIHSASKAIAVIESLGDRLLIGTDAQDDGQMEYAHRIDWGLRTLGNNTAVELHEKLHALRACLKPTLEGKL